MASPILLKLNCSRLLHMLNIFVDYIKLIVYTISCMEEMCNDNIRTD